MELIGGAEAPGRLAKTLKRLLGGLLAIGVERARAWSIVHRVALDCIPAIRRRALEAVARLGTPTTTEVATAHHESNGLGDSGPVSGGASKRRDGGRWPTCWPRSPPDSESEGHET